MVKKMKTVPINRLYGTVPEKTTTQKKIAKFEARKSEAEMKKTQRLEKVSDKLRLKDLQNKPLSDLTWDDVEDLDDLKYLSKEDDMDSPLPTPMSRDYGTEKNKKMILDILAGFDEIKDLAATSGIDAENEIQSIKIDFQKLMAALKINPKIAEKGIKKGLLNYQMQKHVQRKLQKSQKICSGLACDLIINDGLKNVKGAIPGSTLQLYKNNTWGIK